MDEIERALKDEKLRKLVQAILGRYPSVIGQIAMQGIGAFPAVAPEVICSGCRFASR
jgi:hypothetical protein